MALFDKTTPVLRFRRGKVPGAVWVRWPILAWRVVAPVPREQVPASFRFIEAAP